jgi:hypothetical protein
VVLLADRGFLHAELLRWAKAAGWRYRLRGKRNVGLYLGGGRRLALRLSAGELRFYVGVFLGTARLPVELAVGWEKRAREPLSLCGVMAPLESTEIGDRTDLKHGRIFRLSQPG